MDTARDNEVDEERAPPSPADLVRARLKAIAHYAMLAFAPVLSVAALVIAIVLVTNNQSQSGQAQLGELTSRIDSLNASLSDTKNELESLKFSMGREKSMHSDERKKMDERDTKIIQSVTHLQTKLKTAPTLEEQLREVSRIPVTSADTAASAPPAAIPVPSTVGTVKQQTAPAPILKSAEKTPAQAKTLKDAIEKFNKK